MSKNDIKRQKITKNNSKFNIKEAEIIFEET